MILIVLAALCTLTVPLTGGHLSRLADVRLRGLWVPILALAIQVVIVTLAPGGNETLHAVTHVATYVLLGVFLVLNRGLSGIWIIGAGAAMNGLAILVNGGVMPASETAQRIAGLKLGAGFHNSAHLAHPLLAWLGDVIPWPGPLPNVLSIGDCLIFAGMVVVLHRACAAPKQRDTGERSPLPATN
jgi:Family of unknown function (DUF5317)